MKTGRNSPCPCGSGRKYKRCCGVVGRPDPAESFIDSFIELPSSTRVYYLDTCVWGELIESEVARAAFSSHFRSNEYVVALSCYTLFELSRAPRAFREWDSLLFEMRCNVWIPYLYDQLIESEIGSYPNPWRMRWLPVSLLVDEGHRSVLDRLASNPGFVKSRDDHYQFGLVEFMSLEELKTNFPPQSGDNYVPEDSEFFAWCNAVDYLGRHDIDFLKSFRDDASRFEAHRLPSVHIRSLFLFFKYYVHGKSPKKSDFLDFAHVSYAPYCDVYVTERDVCNVLRRIKSLGLMLSGTRILRVSDFLEEICAG